MTAVTAGVPPRIRIAGVTKRFQTRRLAVDALSRVDVEIPDGQFVCIVGPSGCGKTTLLRMLADLERPTEGELLLDRPDLDRPISSMIFQEASIFPWMTVRDNVGYGLRMRGVDEAQVARSVAHFLTVTGLAKFAEAYPHQLSGGMKQRVSVARAFANDPAILLMDEPFAALDEQTKIVLQEELLRLWSETRKTVVFITHSLDEALVLSDRVLVMTARPGRIKADLAVNFPRPRSVMALRADPAFNEMARAIWSMLRDEVVPT